MLYRYERAARFADRVLPPAERFFERHGGKAVFFARFFGGLRVTGAWMAGITRLSWWRFLVWNAAGGVVWPTSRWKGEQVQYWTTHSLLRVISPVRTIPE